MLQLLKLPDGTVKVLVEGQGRAHASPAFRRQPQVLRSDGSADAAGTGRGGPPSSWRRWRVRRRHQLRAVREAQQEGPARGPRCRLGQIEDLFQARGHGRGSHLSHQDLRTSRSCWRRRQRQAERLERALWLHGRRDFSVLQVEKRIRSRVKRQMEKTQREYYLNEQMKAIQKELGERRGGQATRHGRAGGADPPRRKLSKDAREKALEAELKKLQAP